MGLNIKPPGLKKAKSSSEPEHMIWLEAHAKKLDKELNASYYLKQKAARASAKVVLLHREAFSMVCPSSNGLRQMG